MWTLRLAVRKRRRDEQARDITLVWHYHRLAIKIHNDKGRLPTLGSLLGITPPAQTPSEQRQVLETMASAYGLKVTKKKKPKKPPTHGR